MKHKRMLYFFIGLLLLVLLLGWWLRKPLLYGNWDQDVKVLASVEMAEDDSSVTFASIRNWRYNKKGPLDETVYFNQTYPLEDLKTAWFYVQPLDATGLIAHTFVVFEFEGIEAPKNHLGISVETRRKVGEEYSALRGAFRGFMATHIWATEADLTSRRTDYLGYELQKHELQLSDADLKGIFKAFARQTHQLHTEPKFYNTLTHNCTNALARYVNQLKPGSIPWHYSFILTGKSAGYLKWLGYVE